MEGVALTRSACGPQYISNFLTAYCWRLKSILSNEISEEKKRGEWNKRLFKKRR
jgi:hypothetical protein